MIVKNIEKYSNLYGGDRDWAASCIMNAIVFCKTGSMIKQESWSQK